MVLSDTEILKRIENGSLDISPLDTSNIEPASVDLRLGRDHKLVTSLGDSNPVDVSSASNTPQYEELQPSPLIVPPGEFILTTTMERVTIPRNLVATVVGRSSLGRLGISVHQTAGFVDPSFCGQITLELSNHGPSAVKLEPGHRICQIVFEEVTGDVDEEYGHSGSNYQNQSGATPSSLDFE